MNIRTASAAPRPTEHWSQFHLKHGFHVGFCVLLQLEFNLVMFGTKQVDDAIDFSAVLKVKHLHNFIWELGNKMECAKISL